MLEGEAGDVAASGEAVKEDYPSLNTDSNYHYADKSIAQESADPPTRLWIPFLNLPKKSSRTRKSKPVKQTHSEALPTSGANRKRSHEKESLQFTKSKEPPKKSVRTRNKKNVKPLIARNERKRKLEKDTVTVALSTRVH